MSKRNFTTVTEGTHYELPIWKVVDGKGIEEVPSKVQTIKFVRGSKLKDEVVKKVDGILHETLLSMIIKDLKFKGELVRSRENSIVVTKLEEALHWLEERQRERQSRSVEGTYKK
ncbi:MAG: hypothetical protein ACJAVA_000340 [Flavobacteriaceae bacterium]|jgi:hypothetical protein